ncbi:hypothetical protein CBER1_08352 [Cercospora berteroae]|uniref:ATPase AAA-type core domain-containing protein n=1 Tax=Cercospora berteroae TaxID=357750 RepID=A0A2S6CFD3_9PEZI|nr:hypothetical protein CBER1_08352 [Cercospora berteroae]
MPHDRTGKNGAKEQDDDCEVGIEIPAAPATSCDSAIISHDRTGKDRAEEQDDDCEVEKIVRDLSLLEVLAQGPVEVIEEPKYREKQQAIVRVEYQGPICEDGTRNWVTSYPDDCREEPENDKQAIILRYKKDESEQREKPLYLYSISVHNTELKSLIQDAFDGYPGFAEKLASGKFTFSFEQFAHYWDVFGAKLASLQDITLGKQLGIFYAALEEEIGQKVGESRELQQQGLITYGLLSMLFVPGDIVVDLSDGLYNLVRFVDSDGVRYGVEDCRLKINPLKGSRPIESLRYIPWTLHKKRETLVPKLVDRGRRAVKLNEAGYMMHTGFLMLITSKIRGFDFTNKKWAKFEVDNVTDIAWSENAFDRLVLSSARKRLVKALVDGNESHKGGLDDVIRGKGQGLVILLSGVPGTGKTLTAEAISEHLRIPPYSATAVSSTLRALFLRLLEYYRGVLILTTNRQVTFDQAFHSHIHLTMHYGALDQHARAQVWKTFLTKSNLATADYEQLGKLDLNGRRIKHMVKMAQL